MDTLVRCSVYGTLSNLLRQRNSKACILLSISAERVHASHPYRAVDMTMAVRRFCSFPPPPPPPPQSRDRRGRGGTMSHSIDRLFPLLTIHRVGVEVANSQACPVDYVFQPCGTGPYSSPLAIHRPLQDSRRKVACSICVPVILHFPLLYYCQQWILLYCPFGACHVVLLDVL